MFQCFNSAESAPEGAALHKPPVWLQERREQPSLWGLCVSDLSVLWCLSVHFSQSKEENTPWSSAGNPNSPSCSCHYVFGQQTVQFFYPITFLFWSPMKKSFGDQHTKSHNLQDMDESARIFQDRTGLNFMGCVHSLCIQKWMNEWLTNTKTGFNKSVLCNWIKKKM